MKNNDIKSLAKAARKSAATTIEAGLLTALKSIAAKLRQNEKHFQKEIEKGAKKLAKKLSKEIELDEPIKLEAGKTSKVVNGAEKPQAATTSAPVSKAAPAKIAPATAAKPSIASKPATAAKATPAPKTGNPQAKTQTAPKPAAKK